MSRSIPEEETVPAGLPPAFRKNSRTPYCADFILRVDTVWTKPLRMARLY
jgi:hypothetical protein